VHGTSDILLTGAMVGAADFGGGQLISGGSDDVFVARLKGDATHLWSARYGDPNSQGGTVITADSLGRVVAGGSFEGSLDFGGGSLVSAGGTDIFLAGFEP
jgi:hypothetical protein